MSLPVADALARGALVVTPNKRLARELVARHDEAQLAAGRSAWPLARALPWPVFVGELWQRALDADLALPAHRLDPSQSAHLWQRIVAADLEREPLLDGAAAAALAAEAWERVHGYGSGGASWRGFAAAGREVEAFVRWADAFERETRRLDALDLARAPDALAEVAQRLPGVAALDIVLAGFLERSPQQDRLLAALAQAGAAVAHAGEPGDDRVERGRLFAAKTLRDELAVALAWARTRAERDPAARVGIVVHDLEQRRTEVRALAEDVLCPALQWPGRERALRPYDLSLGGALADVPIVAAALDLVTLAQGTLDRASAAALVRSRYLPGGASERAARAALERGWLQGAARDFTLRSLAAAIAPADPDLAIRWRTLAAELRLPARAAPRTFVEAWRALLDRAGWCEGLAMHADELAAKGAWHEVLADVARLAAVAPVMTRDVALRALRDAAQARSFEPEAPGARIRILGVLEAAGLAFDALWVAGLDAAAWPRAPQPNPLLPIAWQRERDVPRSAPARELAYARALTSLLDRAAPEVVFSYAASVDDHPSLPSPLIAQLPRAAWEPPRRTTTARAAFERRPEAERIADERAPAWRDGAPLRGGAGLVESQSACPFQAGARYRLRVEGWPETFAGLPPSERGRFVHAALAAFWKDVRDHATLAALDAAALAARVDAAVAMGRAAVDEDVWHALPPVVAAVETGNVARLVTAWLANVDRVRPPFVVEDTEVQVPLALAGHELALRIDRIDRLPDGRRVVIDYKTGRGIAPDRWFDERPQGPQLPLYAMALSVPGAPAIAGLAYAQIRHGETRAIGLAEADDVWPDLTVPAGLRRVAVADWEDAQRRLGGAIAALGRAVHEGDVRIEPRDAKVCGVCDLRGLCRIATLDEAEDAEAQE